MPIATASASTPGLLDEVDGLIGVGEMNLAGAVAVLDPAEGSELAFDGDALRVGGLGDLAGDGDVVVVVGRRLAVGEERAVHHHAREAELDRHVAGLRLVAVVEVEDDRDLGRALCRRHDQVAQVVRAGIGDRAARGLHDHGRARLDRRVDDSLQLLHVVHVESPDAVAALGSFVEHLPQRRKWHLPSPPARSTESERILAQKLVASRGELRASLGYRPRGIVANRKVVPFL